MKEINFIVRNLVKPILKDYSPVLLILKRNWENLLGQKYFEFCEAEKVYFQKYKKNSGILYIFAFNSVVSFYISNNKSFIIEKINSIFGYNLIVDIKIKQTPKIVKKKEKEICISEEKIKQVELSIEFIENEELKISLKELGLIV